MQLNIMVQNYVQAVRCKVGQKHCLADNDLHYLLSWQRELTNLGNFKQVVLHTAMITVCMYMIISCSYFL